MASIILSFVGNQDPYSDNTAQEGSIVTLVNHLLADQNTISRVILLHTKTTGQRAIDTKAWLESAPVNLPESAITILPVDEALSQDPVNLLLAVQEARRGLEQALPYLSPDDSLEFNASSGTPVMKSSWSVLQAAGYAPHSHVWQIRNPREINLGQLRVFKTDVATLKNEFDLRIIKRQVQDYNYSGALLTLKESNLLTDVAAALLKYGHYRISLDFNRAFSSLEPGNCASTSQWVKEASPLRQKDAKALLQEAYFNTLIRLKNQQYAYFLVGLSCLQENILRFLVNDQLGLKISNKRSQIPQFWQAIKQVDQGNLDQHLQNYTLPRGGKLRLNESISRYVLIGILDYYPQFSVIMPLIKELNEYCDLRNESVHGFVGVSEIEEEARLLTTLRQLMKQVTKISDSNPFDRLNQHICDLLDRSI
jgi:hypothetical protein